MQRTSQASGSLLSLDWADLSFPSFNSGSESSHLANLLPDNDSPLPLSRILDLVSRARKPIATNAIQNGEEIEIKYFLPLSLLTDRSDLFISQSTEIVQLYFEKEYFKSIRRLAEALTGGKEEIPEQIKNVRIRSKITNDEICHFLTIKGPKDEDLGRREFECQISPELFSNLIPHATAGFMHKTRLHVEGELIKGNRKRHLISAEIDIIHELGSSDVAHRSMNQVHDELHFVMVDVELPNREAVTDFRNGKHSFEFLKSGAIELSSIDKALKQPFSVSSLSRSGFDRNVRDAARKLCAKAFKELGKAA